MQAGTQMVVDLDDIFVDDSLNHRLHPHTDDEIAETANSIQATGGVLQNIVIARLPDRYKTEAPNKRYILVAGFGRTKSMYHLAEVNNDLSWTKDVPAILREYKSETDMRMEQGTENIRRKDLTNVEKGLLMQSIKDNDTTVTNTMLAQRFGMALPTVTNLLKVSSLPAEIVDLVDKEEISFSHAREIAGLNISDEEKIQQARIATGETFGQFAKRISKEFGTNVNGTGAAANAADDAAEGEAATGTEGSQKAPIVIRSQVLQTKILPKLKDDLAKAKDDATKHDLGIRIDTIEYVLKTGDTTMEQYLAPWEKDLEAKAEAAKAQKEADDEKHTYVRQAYSYITGELKKMPPAFLEDGVTPNPKREAKSLPEVLNVIRNNIDKSLKNAVAAGKPQGTMLEGFPIKSTDEFLTEISKYFSETEKSKAEHRAKQAAKKAETDAAAKAAKEAETAAATAAVSTGKPAAPAPAPVTTQAAAAAAAAKPAATTAKPKVVNKAKAK